MEQQRRFFLWNLFESSFSNLVTRRVMGVLYLVLIALYAIACVVLWIAGLAASFNEGVGEGVAALFLLPIPLAVLFLLWVFFTRLYFEMVVVLFTIADNTADTARLLRATSPVSGVEPYEDGAADVRTEEPTEQ